MAQKPVVVAVSGGFDPIHVGHVELFERARALGDKLVVILNNDNWLHAKKQHVFMPEDERVKIIRAMRSVDEVIITRHPENPEDMSVCAELAMVKPDIFANGGDRKLDNIPEVATCEAIDCRMIFNIGDKIQSSSWLLADYLKRVRGEMPQAQGEQQFS